MVRKADMPTPRLTNEIIVAAIAGFESQKTRIDAQIAELRAMLPGGTTEPAATPEPTKRKRRKMSAAGKKAIAEAQRKRWAASKEAAEPSAPAAPPKPKRKLSAAAKAKLVANLKKARAAKAAKAKTAAKKVAPARKKTTAKKAAVKRVVAKKAAAKKTATAAAQAAAETAG
jgi:outer membrane biosynthesis protein TonB